MNEELKALVEDRDAHAACGLAALMASNLLIEWRAGGDVPASALVAVLEQQVNLLLSLMLAVWGDLPGVEDVQRIADMFDEMRELGDEQNDRPL